MFYAKLPWSILISTPILFIGGVHRSGSNYIRGLLNQFADIECAKPSIVFSSFLWAHFNQEILKLIFITKIYTLSRDNIRYNINLSYS